MKKIVIALTMAFGLTACNQEPAGAIAVPEQAEIAPAPVQIDHYYSMKDGFEYGYEKEPSADDINAGIASAPLLMASYAGEKNGKHQVFTHMLGTYTVIECEAKCEFLKVMSFDDATGQFISSSRLKSAPGIIASNMISDAANGELEQFAPVKDGKKYNVWYDQEKGFTSTVVANHAD